MTGITKSFGETRALRGVDLVIRSGEILGVAGPNGAGKSTLMRILAGEEVRDAGDVTVNGEPWATGDPRDRVAVVHQEPQLWPNLTVAQNMVVGREPGLGFPGLPDADRGILAQLQIEEYAEEELADCPLAVRQRVEIGRALAQDGRFFLFDEPNSALTEEESDRLFASMHDLATRGRVVLLVTHRLAEMVAHCDRVVVIRDGQVAAELVGEELTEAAIARELVLGYQVAEGHGDERPAPASAPRSMDAGPVAEVAGWTEVGGAFRDVGLSVERGEIVALVGVEGSGARQLAASFAGFARTSGTIAIQGDSSPDIQTRRTVYLPADRKGMLFANMSVGDNLVIRLGSPEIGVAGFLSLRRLKGVATDLVGRFRVRTASTVAPLTSLSGGNQQKVAIAAAIARRPALLVLEEPTRGVDVGSKAEIYGILRDYARAGHGLLVYCTEVPEVFELADRVVVVDGGTPVRSLRVADHPQLTSLADEIAGLEHTAVTPEDLERSHVAPTTYRTHESNEEAH
jgi:ABC-type sugar transport system ATPase subunit